MGKAEKVKLMEAEEKRVAQSKIGLWQKQGMALLNEGLHEKWCRFVENQATDDFVRGALLDETLQIMKMIKANMPAEIIAETIDQIPSGQTIIDVYLVTFIPPEILSEIKSHMASKQM